MNREHLGSRLGFLLLSAGCAIGVGNVWKFPWMVGQYGGGAFVLVYAIFLVILGLPVLAMEFSMGRAAQKSPIHMYQALTPNKKAWGIHGVFCFIGNVVLMMFYTVVAGWLLYYFVSTATGKFVGMNSEAIGGYFGEMLSNPRTLITYMVIISVLGFFILSFSLKGGLERVTKIMMIALLIIMVVIAANSFTLSGAQTGLSFYLIPDFSKINADVLVGAMNQAFFTLSLGIGAMAIFGSYIGKDRSLTGESINVILLDTFVAIVAGLVYYTDLGVYGLVIGNVTFPLVVCILNTRSVIKLLAAFVKIIAFISLIVFRQSTVFLANLDNDLVTMMSILPAFASRIIL